MGESKTEGIKCCTGCRVWKSYAAFPNAHSARDGLNNVCRECTISATVRDWTRGPRKEEA